MAEISINGRKIGGNHSPYIIAEMSGNHNQSFEQAISILDAAVRVGADAIKLQTYTADTLTLNCSSEDFVIKNDDSPWNDKSLYDLYEEAHTPWEWVEQIFDEAKKRNIECFSSVFDESSVGFLENIGVSAYKIASFENNHIPLIRKVAGTKKPLIISTGASSEIEIEEAVENAREAGCVELAILKCTSDYPAKISDSNISSIPYLLDKFQCVVGLSDHTLGIGVAVGSIALGAAIVEKHFITSRELGGVDSAFSADEDEFQMLVRETKNAWEAIGKTTFELSDGEKKSLMFKRSIYACKAIRKGDTFTQDNIRIVRPGYGLHPRHYNDLIGKICHKDLETGDRIDSSFLTN
mgnify:CR=1 FL=1